MLHIHGGPTSQFYDALDLRHFGQAYDLLDPQARPGWTEFATQRSVLDGLATSYARLSGMSDVQTRIDGDSATVTASLDYVTALSTYRVQSVDELHRVGGRWRLVPHEPDQRIPPDQFVSRAGVGYASQGRRQITDGPTAYADVIDRPELRVLSARLVRHDERLSVVGEVRNLDVDPAYVTVTAALLDTHGTMLTWYSGATGAAHTALPGETIPFRIDFEGVAGLVPGEGGSLTVSSADFSPGASTLALDPARVSEVWLSAKAVVTGDDLGRTLQALDVTGHDRDADTGPALSGTLRNDDIVDTTIPHVFVTLRDGNGEVGWVADAFLDESIRPQRSTGFSVVLPRSEDVEWIDVPVRLFANGQSTADLEPVHVPLLDGVGGWSAADLLAVAFERAS